MSREPKLFELTVEKNPQNDQPIVMSGEGIVLTVSPSKEFMTVIRGAKITVTFDFNSILGDQQPHALNK
jgi:hypothetical protein